MSRGDVAEAARYWKEAFELKPTTSVAYNLAIACDKLSRWPDAAWLYSFVIQKDPDFLEAYNNLGLLYRKAGQAQAAIFCFREALKRRDIAGTAFKSWARLYRIRKEIRKRGKNLPGRSLFARTWARPWNLLMQFRAVPGRHDDARARRRAAAAGNRFVAE